MTASVATSETATLSLGEAGFSISPTEMETDTTTNVNGWTVTFQSAFAATVQSSIGVEGMLADDHPTADLPAVFVFQDTAFGTFRAMDAAPRKRSCPSHP